MKDELKIVALEINKSYEATDLTPEAHAAIDDLRQRVANNLAAAGHCNYDEFSDLARMKK